MIRGVASDFDLYIDGVETIKENSLKEKISSAVNFAEDQTGARGVLKKSEAGLVKSLVAPAADVKNIKEQLVFASGQGGLESDFLAYDLKAKKLVDPSNLSDTTQAHLKNYVGSVERLIEGKVKYHATQPEFETKVNPQAQAIRALRTPMELPYVQIVDEQGAMEKHINQIDPATIQSNQKAIEQIDKSLRNSRMNAGNNLIYEREITSLDKKIKQKVLELPQYKRFVPEKSEDFLQKRYEKIPNDLRDSIDKALITLDRPVYHGTKEFKNLVALIRNSFIMSTGADTKTTAVQGWGAYSNENLKIAENYATVNGAVIEMKFKKNARILDFQKLPPNVLEELKSAATKKSMDLNWYLHEEYGIQAIKNSHIMILDKSAVDPNSLPKNIKDYLAIYQNKLKALYKNTVTIETEPLRYLKTMKDVRAIESYMDLVGESVRKMPRRSDLDKIAVKNLAANDPISLWHFSWNAKDNGDSTPASVKERILRTGLITEVDRALAIKMHADSKWSKDLIFNSEEILNLSLFMKEKGANETRKQYVRSLDTVLSEYANLSEYHKTVITNRVLSVENQSEDVRSLKRKAVEFYIEEKKRTGKIDYADINVYEKIFTDDDFVRNNPDTAKEARKVFLSAYGGTYASRLNGTWLNQMMIGASVDEKRVLANRVKGNPAVVSRFTETPKFLSDLTGGRSRAFSHSSVLDDSHLELIRNKNTAGVALSSEDEIYLRKSLDQGIEVQGLVVKSKGGRFSLTEKIKNLNDSPKKGYVWDGWSLELLNSLPTYDRAEIIRNSVALCDLVAMSPTIPEGILSKESARIVQERYSKLTVKQLENYASKNQYGFLSHLTNQQLRNYFKEAKPTWRYKHELLSDVQIKIAADELGKAGRVYDLLSFSNDLKRRNRMSADLSETFKTAIESIPSNKLGEYITSTSSLDDFLSFTTYEKRSDIAKSLYSQGSSSRASVLVEADETMKPVILKEMIENPKHVKRFGLTTPVFSDMVRSMSQAERNQMMKSAEGLLDYEKQGLHSFLAELSQNDLDAGKMNQSLDNICP